MMKKFSFLMIGLLSILSWSACSNKGGSDGSVTPAGAPPPASVTTTGSTCDPANPTVMDFFSGNPITIQKSFNRYERYIGHYEGAIKAYAHSGIFTAYNKRGSTVHVVKNQTDLSAPVVPPLASIDVKSPIQDLAFAKVGDALKLLVATRHNLQVFNVTDSAVTSASSTNVVDGVIDIESTDGKTFVINNKGDAFFTPNDNCLNVSFSRIYDATTDRDNTLKHNYVGHKIRAVGNKAFILTRNRDEFDINIAQVIDMFTSFKFLLWNNKVRFVNLEDKSAGEVKITTPANSYVSVSDIAVSANKLYMAVNEFPLRPPPQNFTTHVFNNHIPAFTTCLNTTPPPPGGCTPPGGSMLEWLMMYLTSNAGVMVQDPSTNVATNVPVFNPVVPTFNLLGFMPINTGFFYSPRIGVNGDTLYMTGVLGINALPNLSTNNTTWTENINLRASPPPAHVPMTLPVSIEFWDDVTRRVGLPGIDDYKFATDTPLADENSKLIQSVLLPTEQGRGSDAQHTDVYQWRKRFQVLDQTNSTTFNTGAGVRGSAFVKGATLADDRYLVLNKVGADYKIRKFKTTDPAETDSNLINLPGMEPPLYTVIKIMSNLRPADSNYSFMLLFDPATNNYIIKAVNNNFTGAMPATDVFSNNASGAGIILSAFLSLGFQKVISTNDSYILYISVISAAIPGSIFNIDRVVIKKDSVAASLTAPYPAPLILSKNTISASATALFAMDADENNVYILGADGVLTTKNATTGSVVGSPLNVYNFSSGEFIVSIPPAIVVRNNKAYTNGLYLSFAGGNLKAGLGYAIADLGTRETHTFPEVQYLSIHGAERLIGAGFLNENGTELFDF